MNKQKNARYNLAFLIIISHNDIKNWRKNKMIIKAYKAIIKDNKEKEVENFCLISETDIRKEYYEAGKIMNVNVFVFKNELYVYIESCYDEILPDILFLGIEEYLCLWPDGENKYFYPQMEIFCFNQPNSNRHWERKQKPDCCAGLVAKIIPELAASYIFYHYQLQEEQPGSGDKYGRIFIMGDTVFFYREFPEVQENALYKGKLDTKNTPPSNAWQSLMEKHFILWDDTYKNFNPNHNFKKDEYPQYQKTNQWLYIKNILSIV